MTVDGRRLPPRSIVGWLSVLCVVLAGCGDRAALRDAVGQAEDTGTHGIEWYAGTVDSAFELARSQGTPVLLYWGADWCPPCSRLKASIFNRREFIERTRLFVPVSLDGDDAGAQKLGENFDVYGYPTMVVLSPHGVEIMRLGGALYLEQYLEAMDVALAATRPVAAAYEAALHGSATPADFRLLAYYSWGQDRERLVPEEHLPDALRDLQGRIPDELAVERALLFIHYLGAFGMAAFDEDREPTLPPEERHAAQEWMLEVLQDPALAAAVQYYVVYSAHWLLPMVAQPDDEGRANLERAWEAALERIRKAPETSPADRVGTYFGEICIVRATGPEAPLPGSLVRRARRAVLTAARDTEDPYARLALFSSAWTVLHQVGHDDQTWDYVLNEVDQSHRPETVMRAIGSAFEHAQDAENALHWRERAWDSATGPTTRFEEGLRLVRTRLALTPEESAAIEDTTIEIFRQLSSEPDAFFHRVTRAMGRLETALHEWNAEGAHDDSLARMRAEVLKLCATIPAGAQSRTNCEAFLASLAGDAAL
ncbi:MAG: thioredoxin family protein [Spirochaetaceae bacterium]|nr:thioredoxin family protein [Spirochaetaceae bacterium]